MVPRLLMEQSEMFRTAVLPLSIAAIALMGCVYEQNAMRHNLAIAKTMPADHQRAYWDKKAAEAWEHEAPSRTAKAALQEEADQQASIREARQGPIKRLNDDQCSKAMRGAYDSVNANGNPHPLPPSYTPQEEYCVQLGRSHESVADNSFPGFMPDGAWSTYDGNGHYTIHYR